MFHLFFIYQRIVFLYMNIKINKPLNIDFSVVFIQVVKTEVIRTTIDQVIRLQNDCIFLEHFVYIYIYIYMDICALCTYISAHIPMIMFVSIAMQMSVWCNINCKFVSYLSSWFDSTFKQYPKSQLFKQVRSLPVISNCSESQSVLFLLP